MLKKMWYAKFILLNCLYAYRNYACTAMKIIKIQVILYQELVGLLALSQKGSYLELSDCA